MTKTKVIREQIQEQEVLLSTYQTQRKAENLTANQKRSITMRIKNAQKKLDELYEKQDEISAEMQEQLDEFFSMGIDTDTLLDEAENNSELREVADEAHHLENQINRNDETQIVMEYLRTTIQDKENLDDTLEFLKRIYVSMHDVQDDFPLFVAKFRYFQKCENLHIHNVSESKVGKFMRIASTYSPDVVMRDLGLDY